MQRNYLSHGDVIDLNNKTYTIDFVIGDGATCVVYSGQYEDSMGFTHRVSIKECYPYNAKISRDGVSLVWEDTDEKNACLTAFRDTYEKLMHWQNENETVNVFDICEANNTKYIIIEANKKSVTFDKDKSELLSDILKTVKLLAHYVGKYHQNGFLHLDIKPSNFLVYPRPSEHIVLFDLDTVTAISDIETGKCKYASYSDGWAAPEQKQGKINKLCPATDIYAVGAVLFEKIMGRPVNNDDIGYFAEWEFDSELFENVNPRIKRQITTIFKKTLSASIKRRYQTTDAFIKDLDKAIKIAESEIYLKGDDICCSGFFVGREKELKCIKESFDSKKKVVFLHGFGGIGKTEIARKYAEFHKKDYDVILFVKYDSNSTLQDKFDEIDIINFDGDAAEHRRKLRNLLDNKTLVIVDNFDVEIGADNGLKVLFDTKAQILVSTRTDFSSVYNGDKYAQVEITELASNELEQVFFTNAKITGLNENDKAILYKIFKLIEKHTYAIELLAKQMYYSGWSIETLYEKVKSGLNSLGNAEKVVSNKDEETAKDNSLNILRAVYCVSDLTEGQKQVLQNLFLLRFLYITQDNYIKYALTTSCTMDDINTLVEIGLVQYDRLYYSLHPLVEELVNYDLNPNQDNCTGFYSVIESKIYKTANYDGYDEVDEMEFQSDCDYLCAFFKYIDLNTGFNKTLLINWLLEIHQNENINVAHTDDFRFSPLYKKLLDLIETGNVTPEEKCNIYYIILMSWLLNWGAIFIENPQKTKEYHNEVKENICKFLPFAIDSCEELNQNKDEYINSICGSFIYTMLSLSGEPLKDLILDVFEKYPQVFVDLSLCDKKRLGLPLSELELDEIKKAEDAILKTGFYDEEIDLELFYKKAFSESKNKIEFFKSIIGDTKYSPIKRAELLWYCTSSVFERLHLGISTKTPELYDWKELLELLELEEDFLVSDDCNPTNNEEVDDWNCYLNDNIINQIIVFAAKNEFALFNECVELLLEEISRRISFFIKRGTHWLRFVDLTDYETISLNRINNALEWMNKSYLMMPILLRFLEGWQEYGKKIDDYNERDFVPLYKLIVECAQLAKAEDILDSNYLKDFYAIEYQYQEKIDSIVGTDFILKIEE